MKFKSGDRVGCKRDLVEQTGDQNVDGLLENVTGYTFLNCRTICVKEA